MKESKAPVAKSPKETIDEPVVGPFVTLWKANSTGWVVIAIWTKGHEVVEKEVLAGPDSKLIMIERFKVEVANRLLRARS